MSNGGVDNGTQWIGDDSATSNKGSESRWSGPVAQFGLIVARAFSHYSGVAGRRERVGVE